MLYGRAAGAGGRVRSQGLTMPDFAGTAELPPGRYAFSVEIADGLDTPAVPVEIGVQLLQPGEAPGLTRDSGQLGPAATPTPAAPARTPAPEAADAGGVDVAVVAGLGVAGIAVGLAAAFVLTRRRPA